MQTKEYFGQAKKEACRTEDLLGRTSVLIIPGWNGSGAAHWQTLWEQKYSNFRRVEQRNWSRPSRLDWVKQIAARIGDMEAPVFLVAHSLGCLAVAHGAASAGIQKNRIGGAFLVAPPWIAKNDQSPRELLDFLPMPLPRLPFPSLFVASEDDHYLPIKVAACLASAWGAQFVNVGKQGHINVASGHGPWHDGEQLLRDFVAQSL